MILENSTPFEAVLYPVSGAYEKDLLLVVAKATYSMQQDMELTLCEEQLPIEPTDQYDGEPGESTLKYASDFCIEKQASDIAMKGQVHASFDATEALVYLKVGEIEKRIKVFGNRVWKKVLGKNVISSPSPIENVPLVYEYSFGGIDSSAEKEKDRDAENRNYIGKGFRAKKSEIPLSKINLPNLEDANELIKKASDRPIPAGFGFIPPTHPVRKKYMGTYDQKWQEERMPLLPKDFDPRFFNAAHPDLIYPGFLKGNEVIQIRGMAPNNYIFDFSLPGINPLCMINFSNEKDPLTPDLKIEKLLIDMDEKKVVMVWNCSVFSDMEFEDIEIVSIYSDVLAGLKV